MREEPFCKMLEDFGESIHQRLKDTFLSDETEGFVVFECVQMDSSHFGERTAVVFGPHRTLKRPEDAEGKWLNDLPSQRQYPSYFVRKEKA